MKAHCSKWAPREEVKSPMKVEVEVGGLRHQARCSKMASECLKPRRVSGRTQPCQHLAFDLCLVEA